MDLSIYHIIKGPRLTSKAYILNQQLKQLVLDVHPQATKPMVAEALRKLFGVEVEKVRVVVMKGKKRKAGRYSFTSKMRKKAIVTLKAGHSVDLAGWTAPAATEQAAPAA